MRNEDGDLKTNLGKASSSASSLTIVEDSQTFGCTDLVVQALRSDGTPVAEGAMEVVDAEGTVTSVTFTDEDLDEWELGGQVTWQTPTLTSGITGYDVYLDLIGSHSWTLIGNAPPTST